MKPTNANTLKEWLLLLLILAIGVWLTVEFYWPIFGVMNFPEFLDLVEKARE